MKYNHFKHKMRAFVAVLAMFALGMTANAQQMSVSGIVKDAKTGEPILGASILEKGTNNGVITNFEGAFTLSVSSKSTLVVRYLGYLIEEVPVNGKTTLVIQLKEDAVALGEVVAIGYGSVKKSDATGAVVALSADKINRGLTTSITDMLGGKVAGLNITTAGGAPGANATVRIRGGSSIIASNDPLYVIDGNPIDGSTVSGLQNALAELNPQDIETFTVLKDASATAIYGSRASNGVILITTKKGSMTQKFSVTYNGNASYSTIDKQISVLNAAQYTSFIKQKWGATSTQAGLLGTSNTNWQDQIYQTSTSQDHYVTVSGYTGKLPYRASVGYTDQNGILKTSNFQRVTGAINLNPTFLDNHLKVDVNLKGTYSASRFADVGSIGAALEFDPTQPVYNLKTDGTPASIYGNGYKMWLGSDGLPINIATANPLSVLTSKKDVSTVYQSLGNALFDYTFHGFSDLRAHLNLSYDFTKANGTVDYLANSPMTYVWGDHKEVGKGPSQHNAYYNLKSNTLLEFYLNYTKKIGIHSIDLLGGYSYQHLYYTKWNTTDYSDAANFIPRKDSPSELFLVSFYGRLNYTLLDKYLFTATLRDDGTSRFSSANRWGLFPSAAVAWKMQEESFLKEVSWLSELKLRAGYGVTGQQNVSTDYYTYIPTYTASNAPDALYQFGNNFYYLLRPAPFNAGLKWESTTTYNAGLDLGILQNRFTLNVDVYRRITNDLLNTIPIPAGSNFINRLLTNVGNLQNQGIEVTLGGRLIQTKDFNWDLNYTVSYNESKITKLFRAGGTSGVPGGGISGGTGNNIYLFQVGYPINSYNVKKQLYDTNGQPIEGAYATIPGTTDNMYIDHHAAPDYIMGMSSRMTYKSWFFNFSLRSNIGNYNYNNVQSRLEFQNNSFDSSGFLKNIATTGLTTKFMNAQYFSDYYVQNASFLKLDNVTLGYSFKKVFNTALAANIYGTVQNVFTITNYKGLDPEVNDGTNPGVDNNIYPRPRVFLVGLKLNF